MIFVSDGRFPRAWLQPNVIKLVIQIMGTPVLRLIWGYIFWGINKKA